MEQLGFIGVDGVAFDAPRDLRQAEQRDRRRKLEETGLTDKELSFCDEYPVDFNATKAAVRAGYSPATAAAIGWELLRRARVMSELAKRQEDRSTRLEITADRVQQEIAKLAFFDPRDFFDGEGRPKHPHEMDAATAAAVAGFEVHRQYDTDGEGNRVLSGVTFKLKQADKGQNLERLGKILGMFGKKDAESERELEGMTDQELDNKLAALQAG